jgi:hypothetical protein
MPNTLLLCPPSRIKELQAKIWAVAEKFLLKKIKKASPGR